MAQVILERGDLITFTPFRGSRGYGIVTDHESSFLVEGPGTPGAWQMKTDWTPRDAQPLSSASTLPHEVRTALDAVCVLLALKPMSERV